MTRVLCALTACFASAVAGCFSPALDGFACGPAGDCPDGYECSPDNQCVLPGGPQPQPNIDAAPPDPNDREPPLASIVFPLPKGMTEADILTVRGTATDASPILAVRVNGVEATSTNAFRDWIAFVPLAPGMNLLSVEAEDVLGNGGSSASSVSIERVSRLLTDPNAMALTPNADTAVVYEESARAIVAIDVATGERTVISDESTGVGPALVDIEYLAVTPDATTILAVDVAEAALVAIDFATGDRRVVSGDSVGSGERFDAMAGLALSPTGDTAFVGDETKNVIFAVDLGTGARTILSGTNAGGTTIGAGPSFGDISALAFDLADNGLLVVDSDLQAVMGVLLMNGDRFLLADGSTGTGPDPMEPIGVAPGPQGNQAYVLDKGLKALLLVNEDTGNRTVVSGSGQGSGARFSDLEAMAITPDLTRAFVTDDDSVVPIVVDLDTGERTPMAALTVGSGIILQDPRGVALDEGGDRLVVTDDTLNGLVVIDLATGDRALLPADDANVPVRDPQFVALHPDGRRAVVVNTAENACVAVDLETGAGTLISSNAEHPGPPWDLPEALALNEFGTVALVADDTPMLVSVNLTTGERVLVSNNDSATGIDFANPRSMILDEARNRVVIADQGADALIAVSLATGTRSELIGNGPEIGSPRAITPGVRPGSAVVYDVEQNDYLLVDLESGERTSLYPAQLRTGAPLTSPHIMTVDRVRNLLLVVDFHFAGVIAIDLVTGERVIASR